MKCTVAQVISTGSIVVHTKAILKPDARPDKINRTFFEPRFKNQVDLGTVTTNQAIAALVSLTAYKRNCTKITTSSTIVPKEPINQGRFVRK